MKNVLLSIIIPCYNAASHIERTLASVWGQDYNNYELILINDGSSDETLSLLRKYEKERNEVIVINQSNKGVSVARNEGLKVAQGRYVCFLDSDDIIPQHTFLYHAKCINEWPNVDLFTFGYQSEKENGIIHKFISSKYDDIIFSHIDFLKLFYNRKLYVHIGSFFVKRDILLSHSVSFLPGCKIGEDIRFLIQMIQSAHSVYYNSKICFQYIIRNDSTMKGYCSFDVSNFSHLTAIEDLSIHFEGLRKDENLFVSVTYFSLLLRYLLYGKATDEIDSIFLMKHKILYRSLSGFSFYHLLIYIFRLCPLRLLFCLKHLR